MRLLMTIAHQPDGRAVLPSTTQWGLPPFAPSTSALTVASKARSSSAWAASSARRSGGARSAKRTALLREAIAEILAIPPKK
jgi:hypothetical protein